MHLATEVLPFALGAAVSPLLLMVAAFALASPPRPVAKGWAVVLGSGVVLVAYTAVFLAVGSKLRAHHHGPSTLDVVVDLTAAALLALLATKQVLGRRREPQRPGLLAKLGNASPRTFATAGALTMATNFSSLVLYVPGMRAVTRSHAPSTSELLATGLLFLAVMAPALLPVLTASLMGRRADRPLAAVNRFVGAQAGNITLAIELIFVVLLTWKGVAGL